MDVKIKKLLKSAVIPTYSKPGDAGLDLTAVAVDFTPDTGVIRYRTGLAIEIPEGYVGLLFPRSSVSKKDLILTNHVGVIDSGYRGEIMFAYTPNFDYWRESQSVYFQDALEEGEFLFYEQAQDEHREIEHVGNIYAVGERVGQILILPYPQINFTEVEELSDTDRGEGGFGSTGA